MSVDEDDPDEIQTYLNQHPDSPYRAPAFAALAIAEFSLSPSKHTALAVLVNEVIVRRDSSLAYRDARKYLEAQSYETAACETNKQPIQVTLEDEFAAVAADEGLNLDRWIEIAGFERASVAPNQLFVRLTGRTVGVRYEQVGTLYQHAIIRGEINWKVPGNPAVSGRDDLMSKPAPSFLVNVGGWAGLSDEDVSKRKSPSKIALNAGLGDAFYRNRMCQRVLSACPSATAFEACGLMKPSSLEQQKWVPANEDVVFRLGVKSLDSHFDHGAADGALALMDSPIAYQFLLALSEWSTHARGALIGTQSEELERMVPVHLPDSSGSHLRQWLRVIPHLSDPELLADAVEDACDDQTSSEMVAACDSARVVVSAGRDTGDQHRIRIGTRDLELSRQWQAVPEDERKGLQAEYRKSLQSQLMAVDGRAADVQIDEFSSFEHGACDCQLLVIVGTTAHRPSLDALLTQTRENAWRGIDDGRFHRLVALRQVSIGEIPGVMTVFEDILRKRSVGIVLTADTDSRNFIQVTLLQRERSYNNEYEDALQDLARVVSL